MSQLDQIEHSIEYAKERITKGEKAISLHDNAAFNDIIVKGYFEKEAQRLVMLYGSGNCTEEMKREMERDMHAIGALQSYLRNIVRDGHQAESDLRSAEDQRSDFYAAQSEAAQRGEAKPLTDDADYAGNLGA